MSEIFADFDEASSTLAVIRSSHEPLLFLTADFRVIAASTTFCRAFQIEAATVRGMPLADLSDGAWSIPGLMSLLAATVSGMAIIDAYELDLKRTGQPTRRLVIHARLLDDGTVGRVRLLVAVNDVTEARAEARHKDDLIREKAILTREVQHRVANSLQIIASILMQNARSVQSDEARGFLQSAHHRVMSIAAAQQQLSVLDGGMVALHTYFERLCASLGASMIADHDRLSIRVSVDHSVVPADMSASLGLIATELVINALKHAFPDQPKGTVTVSYAASGHDWTLSVCDDGIGMATGADAPKAGLGTGIVEALARNLLAEITVTDAAPGTCVTIRHNGDPAEPPAA